MQTPRDPEAGGGGGGGGGGATYRERLWPSPAVWLLVPAGGAAAALVLLPIGSGAAAVGAAAAVAGLLAWLVLSTPVVAVEDGELVAGRAHVPVALLGDVATAGGEQARQERGPGLDARAFLLLRGWIDPVVRAELRDPADPTPYWLVSTRRPRELAAAVEQARGNL